MRSVRIMPDSRNGEVVGLRLSGIRTGSLLEALGMRNGDRLETINGFAMGSAEKALQAYARLGTAERLSVHLNRGGQALDIDVSID
jgi:general secretion pathway protein C